MTGRSRRAIETTLLTLASSGDHHGVLAWADLAGAGLHKATVTRRVDAGMLIRVARGHYLLPAAADRWTPLAVAVAEAGRRVAVTGPAAAALWELDAFDQPAPDVLTNPDLVRRRGRVDLAERAGFVVTSPLATLVDLARRGLDPDLIERGLEGALRRGLTSMADIEAGRHAGTLASILARRRDQRGRQQAPTGSDAETRFVQLLRHAGLPDPLRQHALDAHTFLDFFFAADQGGPLAVEIDGAATHATREALQYDLSRQNRIWAAGLPVLRFTHADVTRRPRVTARRVRDALGKARLPATG